MSTPKMTIGHLRDLIHDLPDSAQVEITNLGGVEWYGIEPLHPGSVAIIEGKLIIDFGNIANHPIEFNYKRQLQENAAQEMQFLSARVWRYIDNSRKHEKYEDYPAPKLKDV